MFDSLRNFAVFAVMLGGLIFFHELGHFLTALYFKIKIKEFGIGFPPRLIGTARDKNGNRRWFFGKAPEDLDPDDTLLSLNWIPLGGFVRPAGEDDPAVPDGLANAPKRARLSVLAAGPGANFLLGFVLFTLSFLTGWPEPTGQVRIADVVPGAPAAQAGILPDDIVLTVNGEAVSSENNRLSEIIHDSLGEPVALTLQRGDQTLNVTVVPRAEWPENQGPTGIVLDADWKLAGYSFPDAVANGFARVLFQIRETVMLPVRLIVGQIKPAEVDVVSLPGLKRYSDDAVSLALRLRAWFPVLNLAGGISVALALTNLLPIPALDGGRILFVLIEAVRRRRMDPLREGYVHMMGLFVLLALMAFLVINDLRRLSISP